ncbi:alpha/beta hydrolase [Noviherbaspirillum cavernae]|uniref:Alpha/beta hydrolase n=1 Tax=Noviherbaspirillum cavernae TaxID=2320862 RepID=A0A418X5F7_9BURK|nr:alpha/beta hydrolase [Noviherbaspirillum cavernae]RJG07702.1 alpha/beta hydrolase [Noviherbaspirillum cavernae]
MRVLHDFAIPGQRARTLAILLPGALQPPEEFVQNGFVDAVRRRRLALDLALVDPDLQTIGAATDGSALLRLHDELLLAQRENYDAIYDAIWLCGISIGGFMAMAYAARYPGNVSGLCLLAPYLGNRMVTGEIAAAGGIAQWRADVIADDDAERQVWRWLKSGARPPMHLGYGREDRFAPDHRLMAATLDPHCVDCIGGAHDWPTWLALWENFLDRNAMRFGQRSPDAAQ